MLSRSERAEQALTLVESLQQRLVSVLEEQGAHSFVAIEWFRDKGRHGGGQRYGIADSLLFGRASINVSQVHYDDEPDRRLGSATAISAIVHPMHPLAPSVHIHIGWTERKNGKGYWRIMADLNPSIPDQSDAERFAAALMQAAPAEFGEAAEQGDRYFFVPALGRRRGIAHFYLEGFNTGDFAADRSLAQKVGEAAIDSYIRILEKALREAPEPTEQQRAVQLAYHTLYFFQVLTLDRGTTMGLLVHDQNDIGILGSLPPRIDKNLLASWRSRMVEPQDRLLEKLLATLPHEGVCEIDNALKRKLANALRIHYRRFPEALDLQASGNSVPPTLDNHR